jgi:hypothetical protein
MVCGMELLTPRPTPDVEDQGIPFGLGYFICTSNRQHSSRDHAVPIITSNQRHFRGAVSANLAKNNSQHFIESENLSQFLQKLPTRRSSGPEKFSPQHTIQLPYILILSFHINLCISKNVPPSFFLESSFVCLSFFFHTCYYVFSQSHSH